MSITITPYYTYDDVLIKPKYSEVESRKNICLKTKLTKNITLNSPLISSNMDTITEDVMAIEMAKIGGMGIIHRYCSIEEQVEMIKKVKRYTNYIIYNPYSVNENTCMDNIEDILNLHKKKSLLVTDDNENLVGIFTNRDFIFYKNCIVDKKMKIQKFMTSIENLITVDYINNEGTNIHNVNINNLIELMTKYKIQKLPIVKKNKIYGLITLRDMLDRNNKEFNIKANLDIKSQLVVGAAIGVNKDYMERADKLIEAGCNIICIDIAHGHHLLAGNAIKKMKKRHPYMDIIAGNVCTKEGVKYLADCGADCIKVGIGPGSICITRKQTGCGAPQLSSIIECGKIAKEMGVSIIADGGHNGTIGNIFKGLCCGASASMLGGMVSGTYETPGQIYTKLDKKVKQIRGMAGIMSNYQKSTKMGEDTKHIETMTPEGVEGYVLYKGNVKDILLQIEGGLKSGLSYVGCDSLKKLKETDIELVLITNNGYKESGSHNIKEI